MDADKSSLECDQHVRTVTILGKRSKRAAQLYQQARATGQRMTTRYSRREGAPLQGWAGGNEGCWATARPAAPPPRPLPAALSQNPPTPSLLAPPGIPQTSATTPHRNTRVPSSTAPRPAGCYSPFYPRSLVLSDAVTSVLFSVIPLLTFLSAASILAPQTRHVYSLSRSFIAFFISPRASPFMSAVCHTASSQRVSSIPRSLTRRDQPTAIFTPRTSWVGHSNRDECAPRVCRSGAIALSRCFNAPCDISRAA